MTLFKVVKFPFLTEGMREVAIDLVRVEPFQNIRKGDPLFTVRTNNLKLDLPSEDSGLVLDVLVSSGDTIKVDHPILVISNLKSSIENIVEIESNLKMLKSDFQSLVSLNSFRFQLIQILNLPYESTNERILEEIKSLAKNL